MEHSFAASNNDGTPGGPVSKIIARVDNAQYVAIVREYNEENGEPKPVDRKDLQQLFKRVRVDV